MWCVTIEKPEIYLKSASCYEKPSPKKKTRFHKVKHYGRLIKNVRLKSTLNQVTSVTNSSCTFSRVLNPQNDILRKCNRAVSLEEEKVINCTSIKRASSWQAGVGALPMMSDNSKMSDPRGKLLAFVTYGRFIKNAWKKRKEMTELQDVYLKSSTAQIKNLKMQVESLKSLLTSDEQIMIRSIRERNSLKILLSTLQEEYANVKAEKEALERKSEDMSEELSKALTELRNGKNNYILIKSEAMAYEVQLEKEREKIAQLKKDNTSLLSKLENMPSSSSSSKKNSKTDVLMELELD